MGDATAAADSGWGHENRLPGTAALYRLDPSGQCSEVVRGLTVSNGLA
jgi:sugar lactone lactonase YvrE